MKDKKIIVHRNERVKNFAFNLRDLIREAVMDEWSRLGDKQKNKSTSEYIKIENERNELLLGLKASICLCPGCNQTGRTMVYNASLKRWYCTLCTQSYIDFYYENKTIIDQKGFVGDFSKDFHETFL